MGGKQRSIGLVVGLIGAALVGWSVFDLLASTSCMVETGCRSPGTFGPWSIGTGIVLAMVGMFMGGGFLIFAALFLGIGGGALAVGATGQMPDMPSFPWLFGGLFFAGGLLPLFLGLAVRRTYAAKQATAEELYRSGVKGVGTIIGVIDTGVTINDNPRVLLSMRIEPIDGSAPVERNKTITASRVAIPRAGDRFPVWFDRADPEKWMFATDMDETASAEAKDLFARARAGGGGAAAPAAASQGGPVEELAGLTALWQQGALTDAEFADAKARLLPLIGR